MRSETSRTCSREEDDVELAQDGIAVDLEDDKPRNKNSCVDNEHKERILVV